MLSHAAVKLPNMDGSSRTVLQPQPAHNDVAEVAPPLMVAPAVLMPERAALSELENALLRVAPAPRHMCSTCSVELLWRQPADCVQLICGWWCFTKLTETVSVCILRIVTSGFHLSHEAITLRRRRAVAAVLLPLAKH